MSRPGVDASLDELVAGELAEGDAGGGSGSAQTRDTAKTSAPSSHVGEIAASGDHGEGAEDLTADEEAPACLSVRGSALEQANNLKDTYRA